MSEAFPSRSEVTNANQRTLDEQRRLISEFDEARYNEAQGTEEDFNRAMEAREERRSVDDNDRLAALETEVMEDAAKRNMYMIAQSISEIANHRLDEGDDVNRLEGQLHDKENRLQELLERYAESSDDDSVQKNEVMNFIIDATRTPVSSKAEAIAVEPQPVTNSLEEDNAATGEASPTDDSSQSPEANNPGMQYSSSVNITKETKVNSINNVSKAEKPVDDESVERSPEENAEKSPVDTSLEGEDESKLVDTSLDDDEKAPVDTSLEDDNSDPIDTSLEDDEKKTPIDTSLEDEEEVQPVNTSLEDDQEPKKSAGFGSKVRSWFGRGKQADSENTPIDTSLEGEAENRPVDTGLDGDEEKTIETNSVDKTEKAPDKDKIRRRKFGTAAIAAFLIAGAAGTGAIYEPGSDKQTVQDAEDEANKTPDSIDEGETTAPDNTATSIEINREAKTINSGEGWNQTMSELGIPSEQWSDVLNQVGPKLAEISFENQPELKLAYFDQQNNEWRINMPTGGEMPKEALELIASTSAK